MSHPDIILVDPQVQGNIGAVARLMKNFGFSDLILYDAPSIGDEAYARAMHGRDVLEEAVVIRGDDGKELDELLGRYDKVIGTSGIETVKEKEFLRKAVSADEIGESIGVFEGDVALVFGREDQGLSNEELKSCDQLINITASEEYPILNLSHAVGIVLYEIFKEMERDEIVKKETPTDKSDRERLMESFSDILTDIDYPEHKRDKTEVLFKKLLGRTTISKWEYHRLMGVFSEVSRRLEEKKD